MKLFALLAIAAVVGSCAPEIPHVAVPAPTVTPDFDYGAPALCPVTIKPLPTWEKNYDPSHPTWPRNTD